MVRRFSTFSERFARGFQIAAIPGTVAGLLGAGLLIAIFHFLERWFGLGWFIVACVCLAGLMLMLIYTVLGYRDPQKPGTVGQAVASAC